MQQTCLGQIGQRGRQQHGGRRGCSGGGCAGLTKVAIVPLSTIVRQADGQAVSFHAFRLRMGRVCMFKIIYDVIRKIETNSLLNINKSEK